jgi:hypothetical protein
MSPRRRVVVPAVALAALLLAGCADRSGSSGDDDAGGTAPDSTSTSSGGDTDTAADGTAQPPFPANTEPDTEEPSGDAFGNVTDLRIGRHDGFDRVVLEFDGAGTPGWDVRYVAEAASQGSGELVEIPGDGTLQVTVRGVGYPFDTGIEEYAGPRRISVEDTANVTEVVFDSTFEGTTVVFVGTESETPFRVYLLEGPPRIVIEVADPA